MGHTQKMGRYASGVVAVLFVAAAVAAQPTDFTGVWTNAGGPGIGGATNTGTATAPPYTTRSQGTHRRVPEAVRRHG